MALTPQMLEPFLTPYISPAEWADRNTRMFSEMSRARQGVLDRQAQQALAAARLAQDQKEAASREKYQGETLKLQKDAAAAENRDKVLKGLEGVIGAHVRGRPEEAASLLPSIKARGGELRLRQPPPAQVPSMQIGTPDALAAAQAVPETMAPPNPYQTPAQVAPMGAVPPLAPPPVPAQPEGDEYDVLVNGEVVGRFSPGEILRRQQELVQAPLDAMQGGARYQDRAAVDAAVRTTLAARPESAEKAVEMAQGIANHQLGRETAERTAQGRNDAQLRKEAAQNEQHREAMEEKQRNFAERQWRNRYAEIKASDKLVGLEEIEKAKKAIDAARETKNYALVREAIVNIARNREPGGRLSNQDVAYVSGLKSLIDRGTRWIEEHLNGMSDVEVESLLGLIDNSLQMSRQAVATNFKQLRQFRDSQRTPEGWNTVDRNLQTVYGQQGFWQPEREQDREYLRRGESGQLVEQAPAPLVPVGKPSKRVRAAVGNMPRVP